MKCVAFLTVTLAVAAASQPPPPPPPSRQSVVASRNAFVITGRVVAESTGDPLPNVRVSLRSGALGAPAVLTDGEGRFTIPAAQDRSTVTVSKTGYGPTDAAVSAGAANVIRLPRGAAISGRVLDQLGEPVLGARVTIERRSASSATTTVVASTDTDDRGEYRLASLPAGAFVLAVSNISGQIIQVTGPNQFMVRPDLQKIFYPSGETAKQADEFGLQAGDDRSGIDLVIAGRTVESDLPPVAMARELARPFGAGAANPTGTGTVRGRVVSTDGRAVAHAAVRLIAPADMAQSRAARADAEGRFEITDLPAGKYDLVASKVGYSPIPSNAATGSDSSSRSRATVDLADAETRERVDIALAPWATLSGRIFDEYGDPVQGVSVQVMHVRYEAGRRRLVAASAATRTDDLGRYRLYSLAPGQYVVSAIVGAVSTADLPGYARSYFPGTTSAAQAQFVSVRLSEEITGVDFSMARTHTARVAGTVFDAAGQPTTGGSFTLRTSRRSPSVTSEEVGARILPDGTFEFPNVPAGQYVIQAYRGRVKPWLEGEFGAMPVVVDDTDIAGLVFQMSAGSSISGRFTFDTVDRSRSLSRSAIELSAIPTDYDLSPSNGLAVAAVHDDWSFEMGGINGPRRLQLLRVPQGWALKEIRVHGTDVTDRVLPFGSNDQSLSDVEVVLTDRVNELTGAVTTENARPVPGSFVIVFSTDRDRWYPSSRFMRRSVAVSDGAFSLSGLPFGSYYAAAIARPPAGGDDAWQDPQLLESLIPGASTMTLSEGEKQVLNLRLGGR